MDILYRINRLIDPDLRHFLGHGDGVHCIHPDYQCEKLLVPDWSVLDTMLDPPQMRDDIAMACLCECQPCSDLRHARHQVDGVEGYPEGVVWR
jgi:hypothetical protein